MVKTRQKAVLLKEQMNQSVENTKDLPLSTNKVANKNSLKLESTKVASTCAKNTPKNNKKGLKLKVDSSQSNANEINKTDEDRHINTEEELEDSFINLLAKRRQEIIVRKVYKSSHDTQDKIKRVKTRNVEVGEKNTKSKEHKKKKERKKTILETTSKRPSKEGKIKDTIIENETEVNKKRKSIDHESGFSVKKRRLQTIISFDEQTYVGSVEKTNRKKEI